MNHKTKEGIIVGTVTMLTACLGLAFVLWLSGNWGGMRVTTAKCPDLEPTIVQNVTEIEGYKCRKNVGSETDLLQPSGYWVGVSFECWKLETPVDEYRRQRCAETGDDYWCHPELR